MARFHLHLSQGDFFRLTPRQLQLLIGRHREQAEYQEYLSAMLAATIANFSFSAPKEPLKPADFMASRRLRERTRKPSRKLIAQNIRCFLLGQVAAQEETRKAWT